MEEDLKLIIHTYCLKHGFSCGGSLSQKVTTGIFVLSENKVNNFCENHFGYLDKDPRNILTSSFKSLFNTEGHAWTHKYVDIRYGNLAVDKPNTGGFCFMYADEGSYDDGKRTVFMGLAELTKYPASGHYFLKDYYQGNEDRVERALKYILYKDVKTKGLIEN